MERIDGYMNLDSAIEKINIKDAFKTDIKGYYYRFSIGDENDNDYYFKECSEEEAVAELLASEMLDILGIEHVKYDMAIINGRRGVISESFKRPGYKYYAGKKIIDDYLNGLPDEIEKNSGTELGQILQNEYDDYKDELDEACTRNNFELIFHAVEYHTKGRKNGKTEKGKILDSLVTCHLADIILLNQDRNRSNWLVEENDEEARLSKIFDNGEAFKDRGWTALRVIPLDRSSKKTDTYIELRDFILRSDNEYFERFKSMFSKLSPDVLESCLEKVEKKIKTNVSPELRSKIICTYKKHYEKLGKMIDTKCMVLPDGDDGEYEDR